MFPRGNICKHLQKGRLVPYPKENIAKLAHVFLESLCLHKSHLCSPFLISRERYICPHSLPKGEAVYVLPCVLGPQRLTGTLTQLSLVVIFIILWQVFQPAGFWGTWDLLLPWVPLRGAMRTRGNWCFPPTLAVLRRESECPAFSPIRNFPEGWGMWRLNRNHCHSGNFYPLS